MAVQDSETRPGNGEVDLGNRSLLVLYGTETGNSQEMAQEIGWAAERLRFRTVVEEMDSVGLKELVQYALVIFVTSTAGQGDIPRNATAFWKSLLRKKLPHGCLSTVNFTIFGLGDSSYPKFNWASRKLQKRLLQLGAIEFFAAGEADERHENGIDSIYLPWFRDLKVHLTTSFPLPGNINPVPDNELLPPKYPITVTMGEIRPSPPDKFLEATRKEWEATREKNAALSHVDHPRDEQYQRDEDRMRNTHIGRIAREGTAISKIVWKTPIDKLDRDNILRDHPQNYLLPPLDDSTIKLPPNDRLPIPGARRAKVAFNQRITPSAHWQDTRYLKIDIQAEQVDGKDLPIIDPGATVTIFPKNFLDDVDELIEMMNWGKIADEEIQWPNDSGTAIKLPRDLCPKEHTTLRDLLIHNLDITSIPTRSFLKQISHFTTDDREKERLQELTFESNTHEFYDYTSRPRRTIIEVLQDFPTVKIPFERVLELFPIIRGREYSIANTGDEVNAEDEHEPKDNVKDEEKDDRLSPWSIQIDIIVSLVEYKTIIRKPRQGLCSRYIKHLKPGTPIQVAIVHRTGPPHGKENAKRPLLAIATGTGIAPIRHLLYERDYYAEKEKALLFFGCRNKNADFYFELEYLDCKELEVIPAFSRDPVEGSLDRESVDPYTHIRKMEVLPEEYRVLETMDPGKTGWTRSTEYDQGKMYVQHMIRKNYKMVCFFLTQERPAIIMICGTAGRMPTSVRRALADALIMGGVTKKWEEAAEGFEEAGKIIDGGGPGSMAKQYEVAEKIIQRGGPIWQETY